MLLTIANKSTQNNLIVKTNACENKEKKRKIYADK